MNQVARQYMGSISLAVQTRLDHRFGAGLGVALLYPPPETFEALGGRAAIAVLVDGLYDRIETDSRLRPAFGRDLAGEREKLKLFLEAWFGGAPTYFNEAWPPGLKAAHGGVSISRGMACRWVGHFLEACADAAKDPVVIERIKPFVSRLAMALVNRPDEPVPGEPLRGSTSGADPRLVRCVRHDDAAGIAQLAAAQSRVILRYGPRLLLLAAVRGKARAAEELLGQGVDVNAPALLSGSEATAHSLPMLYIAPLCGALAKRHDPVVKLLAEHGAQYDIFSAACIGDLDTVRELLDLAPELADAGDPASDVAQITPLMHAVCAGQLEIAQLLLQRGATVGRNSVRLVRAAANRGHKALTDLLLGQGANPTAIGAGAWVLYPAIADRLLARGADVNQKPGAWIGMCCTGNSGHKENVALARSLLRYGANTAARYKGRTALHCAAKAGFISVVGALIEHGADVNALNDRGQTPLDEVEDAGRRVDREPVRRLLIAHGARRSQLP